MSTEANAIAEPEVVVPDGQHRVDSVTPTDNQQEPPLVEGQTEVDESEPEIEEAAEPKPFSEYKDAFNTHPELRTVVGREKAFSELFPKFSEAKQLRDWFPSQEDAERIVDEASNLRTMGETFRNDPAGYMDSLRDSDPSAYGRLVESMPTYLAQADPSLYTAVARPIVNTVFDNLYDAAVAAGDKDFVAKLTEIASKGLGINLGGYRPQMNAGTSETERLRQQLKERDDRDRQSGYQSFVQETDDAFSSGVMSHIDEVLNKSTFPEKVKETIKGRLWTSVNATMKNQPAVKREVETLYAKAQQGRATRAEQSKLIDFLKSRAISQIPSLYKSEAATWAKVVVSKSQADIDRKQVIANTTKDAGSGAGGTGAAKVGAKPMAPGQRRTMEQVMSDARSGTYARS